MIELPVAPEAVSIGAQLAEPSADDCLLPPAYWLYGRADVPSGQRATVHSSRKSLQGYLAAFSSSMSIPRPGRSFGYMNPPRTSGQPGNTSYSTSGKI